MSAGRMQLLQAALVGGLTIGAVVCVWNVLQVHHGASIYNRTVQDLQRTTCALVVGAKDFVGSRDRADRAAFDEGLGAARSSLSTLRRLASGMTVQLDGADAAFAQFDEAAAPIWSAPDAPARAKAKRAFDVVAERAFTHVRELQATAARLQNERTRLWVLALAAHWLMALLAYGVTSYSMRKRWRRQRADALAEVEHASSAFARQLDRALEGDPVVNEAGHSLLVGLGRSAAKMARTLAVLRKAGARKESLARFSRELDEAFDLSSTEDRVMRTAERAASHAFPNHGFAARVADSSYAVLEQLAGCGALCNPDEPSMCPSIRRNRLLTHAPDAGLGRCPHLKESSDHVSCTFVSVDGRAVGALQVVGTEPNADDRSKLEILARATGARLGAVRTLGERELQAATDVLTGLSNRRSMQVRLAQLDRTKLPYALVAADLDHFKKLNDTHGHEVGDRCLKIFAQVLRDCCRDTDLPCRPGGEEFTIILAESDVAGAERVAERIRDRLSSASRRGGVAFTASLGVAAWPEHGADADAILGAADQALYAAKESGRDRVARAGDQLQTGSAQLISLRPSEESAGSAVEAADG